MRSLHPGKLFWSAALFGTGFFIAIFLTAAVPPRAGFAQSACVVGQGLLARLYNAIFHRPLDVGANGYVGHDIDFVLDELSASQEHAMYSAVFGAVKALENRQREAGAVSDEDIEVHRDYIDSALSIVNEWAQTLPEQARADAVIGSEQARDMLTDAYSRLLPSAQEAAEFGLFRSLERIGEPSELPVTVERTVEADDDGLYPATVSVPRGATVNLTFKVRTTNVYFGGLDFRSAKFSTSKVSAGGQTTVTFVATSDLPYSSFWPATSIKKADGTVVVFD